MAIGKRFKKKMKNPRAGNSYWRIWGWSINPTLHDHFLTKYKDKGVIVGDVWVEMIFETVQGVCNYNRSHMRLFMRLNGTFAGYYRTRKQAQRVLQEIKDGKHPEVLAKIRSWEWKLNFL